MKLETILNAYGNARAKHAKATGLELLIARKYHRQAEKFKVRLMRVLHNLDEGATLCKFDVCPFMKDTNTADYKDEYDTFATCGKCGSLMQIVRPGKWQCPNCE